MATLEERLKRAQLDARLAKLRADTQQQATAPKGSVTDLAKRGFTFGFGDEVGAAGAATGAFLKSAVGDIASGEFPDLGDASTAAGRAYDRRLGEIRQGVENYRQENPVLATGAEVLGGLATGGTLARGGATLLNAVRPTLPSMVGRGAAEGAAYGTVHGFGTGEGAEDRLQRAGAGAALGAATGGAVGAVGARMARPRQAAPTTQDLRRQADAAYDAAEQAGLVVSDVTMGKIASDISAAARQAGIDRTIHPKATAALARVEEASGTQPTLQELDLLRRIMSGAARDGGPDERRIAGIMIDRLDDAIANLTKADVVAGDPEAASTAITQARELWSRMRKSEMIEDALTRAQRRAASTGSGGNVDNAIRQNIRAILDNPKKARAFTEEERKLMERVVRGDRIQNLARLVGKLSPQGNGLMLLLHGTGGVMSGGATIPLAAVGSGAKAIADRATPRNVNQLLNAVRLGQTPIPNQLTPLQRALLGGILVGGSQQSVNALNP